MCIRDRLGTEGGPAVYTDHPGNEEAIDPVFQIDDMAVKDFDGNTGVGYRIPDPPFEDLPVGGAGEDHLRTQAFQVNFP